MPSNLVKTERDEGLWQKAKDICRREGVDESDDDRFYRCVNGMYQKLKGDGRGGGQMPNFDMTGPAGEGPMTGRAQGMAGEMDEETLQMAVDTCRRQGVDESNPEAFQRCVLGMYRRLSGQAATQEPMAAPAEAAPTEGPASDVTADALRRWATSY